ncbi:MAG: ABC transporter ATP-binding protein [Anaerolineae bacterium]|nr:ABC transporter ATP-binding protein [Anaerolineae bacterium]
MVQENGNRRKRRERDFDLALSLEEQERRAREEKIQDLLPDEDELLGKAYDGRLVRRLLHYNKPYVRRLVAALVLMAVSSLLSVSIPWLFGRAIDDGIRSASLGTLRFWSVALLVAATGEWITNRARIAIMAYVGTRVVADVRSELFRHLHTLSLNFYNNYSIGRLMSRLISDVGVLQDFISWSLTGLTRATFTLAGIIIAMLVLNWQLALVTFAVLPLMIVLTNYWRKRVRDAYRATRQRLSLINGYLNESLTGIRVTKSFTRESHNLAHFNDLNASYFDANVGATRLSAIFFPGVDFMGSLATALVVGVGGYLVLGETLTAGTLVAFVLYVERFFEPIRELAQRYNTFQATMAASERIFNLLNSQPDLADAPDAYPLPPIEGRVDFEHVAFGYNDEETVLRDINLHVEPGQRIALVGETGAGKSTIIRLLARFFDVDSGSLRIDGHDIRKVTRPSLRQQLGIVLQDTFLFSGTIADNIRYGRLDASDEDVEDAARAVGAHDFIMRAPDGYATEAGENGVNLSVGQRQMVSFARALLADPRILILDEATSSVDTATEKQIGQGLRRLMEGRTSFVIAHRLSTIVDADLIVVMDEGRIVEQGAHEELLARGGRYYNLYTMQWAAQDENGTPATQFSAN